MSHYLSSTLPLTIWVISPILIGILGIWALLRFARRSGNRTRRGIRKRRAPMEDCQGVERNITNGIVTMKRSGGSPFQV